MREPGTDPRRGAHVHRPVRPSPSARPALVVVAVPRVLGGSVTPRPLPLPHVCTRCGHDRLVHYLTGGGVRTWCTTWTTPHHPCPCLTYTDEDDQVTYSNGLPEPDDLPPHLTYQPYDHDPITAVDGRGRVMADCVCGWSGPERTGDEHAARLVHDDVLWHLDVVGGRL